MFRRRPLALVYRGPAACDDCPDALADLLSSSCHGFDIRFVGDDERHQLSRDTLGNAVLYAQPGGGNSLKKAYKRIKASEPVIRDYVSSGGRYLGICMGGYLADGWRGFDLLPDVIEADPYVGAPGADITTDKDTTVQVDWLGSPSPRPMFFQDGPLFLIHDTPPAGTTVVGRYAANGAIAALVAPFGRGWVGVSGPHPEAPDDWYTHNNVPGCGLDGAPCGHQLIDTLMAAGR